MGTRQGALLSEESPAGDSDWRESIPFTTCISCHTLIATGSYCETCRIARQRERDSRRGTAASRGYDYEWQRLCAQAIADNPQCCKCGTSGSSDNPLTGDHIVPLAHGGTSVRENVQVLCRSCNSRKGNRINAHHP